MPLSPAAIAFRGLHTAIAIAEMTCLGYVWYCAITRRRDRALGVAIAALSAEGVGLVTGKGNCPLGPLQQRIGDPVPLFELVLPQRAAKAAVPVLTAVAALGVVLALVRPPHQEPLPVKTSPQAGRACVRDVRG
ncbi:MAG: hypothetical protein QM589_14045 [Thermomicrobiales bacterium]